MITRFAPVALFLVAVLAININGQAQNIPLPVSISISSSTGSWQRKTAVLVTVTIENSSHVHDLRIGPRIYFQFSERQGHAITTRDAAFWGPATLTKKYRVNPTSCQGIFDGGRVHYENHGTVKVVTAQNRNFILHRRETRSFTIDLRSVCWAHQMAAGYPSVNLTSLLAKYPDAVGKTFRIYVEMPLEAESVGKAQAGRKFTSDLKSNQIDIVVN